MDKKDKNPNVPNLRFAEYLDTWNNQRIDSNSLIVDGTHQTPNYITEGVKFVSVENIKNPYESNKFISKEDYNSYKIKPRIGDILMTRITAGIIGETYVINKTEDLGYYVSLALIRPDNKYINSNFLSYYINSPYFKHELDKRIIKVAFPRKINLNDIGECKISIPSLIEQEKIATLLNKIDRRIETQSKIINAYESLINSISSSLFEKIGARTKLSEICVINKGQQINGVDLLENGLYYMMNGGTSPSGYLNIYNKEANTISISEGGNSCGYVQFNLKKFWSGGHCYTIENLKPTIKNKFLYYYLKFNESKIMNLRIGTGLPNIQKRDLEQFMVTIPNIENQIQITNILDCIETKLNKEKKLLTLYQSQKNYLLKNMFV